MAPIGQLKQNTLLIEISQSMPLRYAWQGMNYGVLIEEGNLKIQTQDGLVPTISPEDMESTTLYTYKISRDVYHKIIKKQKNLFIKHWVTVYNDIHQIIEYMIKHTESEKTYESKSLVNNGKDESIDDEDE